MPDLRVLNIEVTAERFASWLAWYAPARQPFLLSDAQVDEYGLIVGEPMTHPNPLRDTYEIYAQGDLRCVWLDRPGFDALPRPVRAALVRAQVTAGREAVPTVRAWAGRLGAEVREQADGYRFVWWPDLIAPVAADVLVPLIEDGVPPDRTEEVDERVWAAAAGRLPGARALAGTFPDGSGPNCFGTVMAAAGVPGAAETWMLREPFEAWLAASTRPGGENAEAGTVLLWRDRDGLVQHAGVTLGGGWALNKRSQTWMSPRAVARVADVVRSSRGPGMRLTRHAIVVC